MRAVVFQRKETSDAYEWIYANGKEIPRIYKTLMKCENNHKGGSKNDNNKKS